MSLTPVCRVALDSPAARMKGDGEGMRECEMWTEPYARPCGAGDTVMNRTDTVPVLVELTSPASPREHK